jgi:hypothetical protein
MGPRLQDGRPRGTCVCARGKLHVNKGRLTLSVLVNESTGKLAERRQKARLRFLAQVAMMGFVGNNPAVGAFSVCVRSSLFHASVDES